MEILNHYINRLFFTITITSIAIISNAQIINSDSDYKEANEAIEIIKERGLIVKLYTQSSSIKALKERAEKHPHLAEDSKKKLDKIIKQRNWENQQIIQAFKLFYSYSDVYFIPDFKYEDFRNGVTENIFWDASLTFDNSVEVESADQIVMAREFSNRYDWKICNSDLQLIPNPFPNYYALQPVVVQFLTQLFTPNRESSTKHFQGLVQKIQRKFEGYY